MELLIIGSGAAYPDRPGTASSCYLVTNGDTRVLLDIGQGAFAGLAGRMEPSTVRAVLVSHLHPDHFVDLVPLRHYLRYEFAPPRRVRVIGPAGLADRLDGLLSDPGFAAAAFDIEARGEGALEIGELVVESHRVTHAAESYACRVSPAGSPGAPGLVYSGDCGRATDLAPLVRPGDTLLCEVSFGIGPVPVEALHLDGPAVGRLAAATGTGRLLLTHLQMHRDPEATLASVRALYGEPVEFVADGGRYSV